MMNAPAPTYARELRCPCGRYLGSVDLEEGRYLRLPPCECGWQWVGEAVGKRARQMVETPAGAIEVKAR